jgi:cytochrome d ubiquinol oxidase subunit II
MNAVAFILLAFMLGAYVLLDGYDLGIAAIAPLVARTSDERQAAMHAIGPFWNGNEVWLIAAGGALFALFPKAYASAFSGFYLPFVVVLWMLMFRGIAMELRSHFPAPIWRDFWDFCFTASSLLLILLFGVALGNLVRGLPLDAAGYFAGTFGILLNPFAILVGVLAIVALALHGALFLIVRVDGPPAIRARDLATRLWPVVLLLYIVVSLVTFRVNGGALQAWWIIFPIAAFGGAIVSWIATRAGRAMQAFAGSSLFLASLLAAAGAAMYPYLLPGFPIRASGLSVVDAAPSAIALVSALAVVIVGVAIVLTYGAFLLRAMREKISV